MYGTNFWFNSHDTKKHTQYKVSISDCNRLSILGSSSVNAPNGTLEVVFHIQGIPINSLSIWCACQKCYKFEACLICMC